MSEDIEEEKKEDKGSVTRDEVPYFCRNEKDLRNKLRDRISKRKYQDLESCLKGELTFREYKMAEKYNLLNDPELNFMIESRKAKLREQVVTAAMKNGKVDAAFKLLAENDEQRAMLNTHQDAKSGDNKQKSIKIIHGN